MAADSLNRETVRDALVTLLQTALVGAGLPVQAVYGYQVGDAGGQSPAVVVSSAGSERRYKTMGTNWHDVFYFNVYAFVLYADSASSWTEANAEDRIDLIEKEIADTVMDNRTNANWDIITIEGPSIVDGVEIGGEEYRRELTRIKVEKYIG